MLTCVIAFSHRSYSTFLHADPAARQKILTSLPLDLIEYQYNYVFAGSLESAYSLIWDSHKIWGKGGGDTLALL